MIDQQLANMLGITIEESRALMKKMEDTYGGEEAFSSPDDYLEKATKLFESNE
jgi:hypothetical protein